VFPNVGFRPPSRGRGSVSFGPCITMFLDRYGETPVVELCLVECFLGCLKPHRYTLRFYTCLIVRLVVFLQLQHFATSSLRYSNFDNNEFSIPKSVDRTLVLINAYATRTGCGGQTCSLVRVKWGRLHSHSVRKLVLSLSCVLDANTWCAIATSPVRILIRYCCSAP
jgi:hypothetical protein